MVNSFPWLGCRYARSVDFNSRRLMLTYRHHFSSPILTIDSKPCVHLWKSIEEAVSARCCQSWTVKLRRIPLDQLVETIHFAKMTSRCLVMFPKCVHEFTGSLAGTTLYWLDHAVVVGLRRTTRSKCFFECVLSSAKEREPILDCVDTPLSLSVALVRHQHAAGVRQDLNSYNGRPRIYDFKISNVVNSTKG